jgi:hypothetical protein
VYEGYLRIGAEEVVNTHRASAYAAAAGLPWVQGCSQCTSIVAGVGHEYETPLLDANRGDPPPWWDGSMDAAEFCGVIGMSVANADDSTRQIAVLSGAAGAGHFGALRFGVRAMVVRALAVAASDCALGYGLEWLRGVDGSATCTASMVTMYDCCPHVSASDCVDEACINRCVQARQRFFYGSRITSGPTVLRRREMTSRGWMAEVEFVVTATDPFIYSGGAVYAAASPQAIPWTDPPQAPMPVPVDAFAAPVEYALPPSLTPTPRFLPRTSWERQRVLLTPPEFGTSMTPTVRMESSSVVPSVRVTLRDTAGDVVGQWRMEAFPTGGIVTMDFRTRSVTTESNGIRRRNDSFVMDAATGGPARWPDGLPIGEYTLDVDRSSGTAPLDVTVATSGRVSA